MTSNQEQNRINAILAMGEMTTKVLWDKVVERGRGMNFKVHGAHESYQGVMETVRTLTPEAA